MIRAEIIVRGEVQKVGYRDFVKKQAKERKLFGLVENLKNYDEDVRIVCEGEDSQVKEFIAALWKPKRPAKVAAVVPTLMPATETFTDFEIKRGAPDEENGERLDYAARFMQAQDEKMDKLLGGQDKSTGILKEHTGILNEHTTILKENTTILKENTTMLKENTNVLKGFREETKHEFERIDSKYGKISDTLGQIATTLTNVPFIGKAAKARN